MTADVRVVACEPKHLASVVAAVDAEFIIEKGRALSLAARFPRVFANENAERISAAFLGEEIVAVAAAKPFAFLGAGRTWSISAVGAVWTHRSHRGQGLASRVLTHLRERETQRGVHALVLWTSLHDFYSRLQWQLDDPSVLGTVNTGGHGTLTPLAPFSLEHVATFERLRAAHAGSRVIRTGDDWRSIPIPATRLEVATDPDGYVLVGRDGETGYVYEFVASGAAMERLWTHVTAAFSMVYVNESAGSPAARWLSSMGVRFTPQAQAMWLSLYPEANALAGHRHVPYLDRI